MYVRGLDVLELWVREKLDDVALSVLTDRASRSKMTLSGGPLAHALTFGERVNVITLGSKESSAVVESVSTVGKKILAYFPVRFAVSLVEAELRSSLMVHSGRYGYKAKMGVIQDIRVVS